MVLTMRMISALWGAVVNRATTRVPLILWSGCFLWFGVSAPVPGAAQLLEAWRQGSGVAADARTPPARLLAMGGMQVAVADENHEVNLLDFAGNITGHLTDKPSHHIDAFSGPRTWRDRTTLGLGDQAITHFPTLFQVNLKPSDHVALGGTAAFFDATAERLVTPGLRQTFVLPVEENADGSVTYEVIDAGLQGPALSGHGARRFGDKLAAGIELSWARQREEKGTPARYQVDHIANTTQLAGSFTYRVVEGGGGTVESLVAGANGAFGRTRFDGRAISDVHIDQLDWERPLVAGSVHVLGDFAGDTRLGVDFRYQSFEGRETAHRNWSELFFLNPTGRTLIIDELTFEEGFRSKELELRFQRAARQTPIFIGAGFRVGQNEYWQLPQENTNSYVQAKILRQTAWRAAGGASYRLPRGRGLVAGELAYGFDDLDRRISKPTRTEPKAVLEIGAGGEYFPFLRGGVRGGFRLLKEDGNRDLDDPVLDTTTRRASAGLTFRTEDAQWQLDATFVRDWVENDAVTLEVEDAVRNALTMQLRWTP